MSTHHRPRKRFGQHFLCDPVVITDIVNEINSGEDDHLIEIGPGPGILTEHVIKCCRRLDVIEIDRDLVKKLQQQFGHLPQLHIHNADALKFPLDTLDISDKARVFGNLPYNISTPLLFHLFGQLEHIEDMVFMLQREVVLRMAADVGSKHYGRLSVMTQYFCTAESLFDIEPTAFNPPPKVMSSIVRLDPNLDADRPKANDLSTLSAVVKQAFMYRRKTVQNALQGIINKDSLEGIGINPMSRPQQLSVADFVAIANGLTQP